MCLLVPIVTAAAIFGLVQPSVKTSVALLNPPGNDPAEVDLYFFSRQGNEVEIQTINLQPGEKISQCLDQIGGTI